MLKNKINKYFIYEIKIMLSYLIFVENHYIKETIKNMKEYINSINLMFKVVHKSIFHSEKNINIKWIHSKIK